MSTHPPIAPCADSDVPAIFAIINESAAAYRGAIPAAMWHEPYMPMDQLRAEIARGVRFYGYRLDGDLVAVMGIEDVKDVTLIRHAYVRTAHRRAGFGGALLLSLRTLIDRPVLIGTWKAATWAIRFYAKHGFVTLSDEEGRRLLDRYWTVPESQKSVSLVLVDSRWQEVLR